MPTISTVDVPEFIARRILDELDLDTETIRDKDTGLGYSQRRAATSDEREIDPKP